MKDGAAFGAKVVFPLQLEYLHFYQAHAVFSIKKVRVEQGDKITSENSTLTDGKFRIRKDWDSGW
ncbi:hypothetical protein DYBT9275_04126 [Dyadobacter sp. CECT 9275]|uniref:Uncharacterized protein n=1 Tax=Dyadobacter helix TaxID=2822344 RepID=A0A916ND03_9BACT|nr:hypothetical protein [Dyadobacter sp. CECT 9275]CAG5007789.1 hypothetical protein DYBT9275_04126 [Dyadobacter sp. CECT 9275]